MARLLRACLTAALFGFPSVATAQEGSAADSYLGAEGCKECHAEVAAAWAKTKHATALNALSGNNRTNAACLTCHITVLPRGRVESGDESQRHPHVQCEACHGPGRAHAAQAPELAGLFKSPGEKVCFACHNDRSPSFKGFYFVGMKGVVHRH